jgi:hypothetical protein
MVFWSSLPGAQLLLAKCEVITTVAELETCQGYVYEGDYLNLANPTAKTSPAGQLEEHTAAVEELSSANNGGLLMLAVFGVYVAVYAIVAVRRGDRKWTCVAKSYERVFAALMVLLLVLAFCFPLWFASLFSGMALLPVVLGAWIPLLHLAGRLNLLTRITITVAISALLISGTFVGGYHDIRTFKSVKWEAAHKTVTDAVAAPTRQVYLDDALTRWRVANDCGDDPKKCPPLLLVAAEGGGSRAAFFTATVIGAILDETRCNPNGYFDFQKALFAVAGVSGGALGAATVQLALADSKNGAPPCSTSVDGWFGADPRYKEMGSRDPLTSWRSCLQELTTGDYLSPTVVGLLFRDTFASISPADRATVFEQAVESITTMLSLKRTRLVAARKTQGDSANRSAIVIKRTPGNGCRCSSHPRRRPTLAGG